MNTNLIEKLENLKSVSQVCVWDNEDNLEHLGMSLINVYLDDEALVESPDALYEANAVLKENGVSASLKTDECQTFWQFIS